MPTRRDVLAGLAAAGIGAGPVRADPRPPPQPILRAAWRDRLESFDPYRTPLRSALMLAHELFDCLLDRDPETFQFRPLLAQSWAPEGDRALVFTLRPGVTFHDGQPFEAEDVVATVRAVLSDPRLAIPSNYSWLAGADARGPDVVRLRLAHPFPAAADYIAMVLPILPRGVTEPDRRAALAAAPVGTGPYRLSSRDSDGTLYLSAFEPTAAPPPKGLATIRRLLIRQDSERSGPFQDLLDRRADWMWQLTPAQARAVTADQRLQVVRSESMRVFYLAFDAAGRGGLGIPFTRLDVRRAACHAIDRDALASDAAARPAIAPCAPTQFACDASVAVRYDHDPGQSRALLAAAGFPDGIDTELVTDAVPALARAVAADLAEGGFRARLTILPAADALARVAAGTAPLFLGSWGSSSINDISAFLPPFFEFGPLDTTRDSQLASLLAEAELAADPEQRRGLYQQAIQRITDQAFFLPLFVDPSTYGIARRLVFRPTPDELPRFYQMAWR